MTRAALTIAGSDPIGGAGLQADLKTFHQHALYGMGAVTLLTAQDSSAVLTVSTVSPTLVRHQIEAVLADWPPDVIKIGALGQAATVLAVKAALHDYDGPIVLDPVFMSTSGCVFLDAEGISAMGEHLLPRSRIVTPNLAEATALTGRTVRGLDDLERAGRILCARGAQAVLCTGGHLDGPAIDVLCLDGACHHLEGPRLPHTAHGTGCMFSAALAAGLAWDHDILTASMAAKRFVHDALKNAASPTTATRLLDFFTPPDLPTRQK